MEGGRFNPRPLKRIPPEAAVCFSVVSASSAEYIKYNKKGD
jgi:hypothetical protein